MVPFLLHVSGNLLTYVAALFVCLLLSVRGREVRAWESYPRGRRFVLKAYFYLFLFNLIKLLICRDIASVCAAQFRLCKNASSTIEQSSVKITKNFIDF